MSGNQDQAEYWASPAGLKWIEHEQALDAAMAGMLEMMLDEAGISLNHRIIDIRCGTGASTIAAARRVPDGHVIGVDISEPLLSRAKTRAISERALNTSFLLADAQIHPFEEIPFDVLVSRIGMSFFSDTVAALKNLAAALSEGGKMVFLCWAGVEKNPWFHIPKAAAERRLGALPPGNPNAPGPTAFQDARKVTDMMADAGLRNIASCPVEVILTPSLGAEGAARAASRVGPAARIMKARKGTERDAVAIENEVKRAFEVFEKDGVACVPATVNLFSCTV